LAKRAAGARAASRLRDAWTATSNAVEFSPELPSYYTGPYYLGPMHPMCADAAAPQPDIFNGRYLFHAEMQDEAGLKKEPTYQRSPGGNVAAFGEFYRRMKNCLSHAADDIRAATPLVDARHRLTFDAEAWPILWFYHTARTHSNFYESCKLRDAIAALSKKTALTSVEKADATRMLARWKEVLQDELKNTAEALPLIQSDMRLDPYYGGDHTFSHGEKMMDAKLTILKKEISEHLPSLEAKFSK
jgi:hypothetical protein